MKWISAILNGNEEGNQEMNVIENVLSLITRVILDLIKIS